MKPSLWRPLLSTLAAFTVVILNATSATPVNATTVIDVRAAGAHGDGVTDDSAVFKSALGTLAQSGGTLLIPQGTYVLKPAAQVSIPSGVTVDGLNRVVRGITVGSGSSDVAISHSAVRNIKQPTDPSVSGYPQNFAQVPAGIRVEGNGNRISIDSTAVRQVVAVNWDSSWPHPTARGIWITPAANESTSKNVTITNSSISDVGPKDDGDCIVLQGNPGDASTLVGVQILNNTFDGCHKRAIKVQLPGVLVSGNRINNPFLNNNFWTTYPAAEDNFDMFSAISAYASGVAITNNTIGGVGSFYNGIEADSGASLTGIAVIGNRVSMGSSSRIAYSSLVRVLPPTTGLAIQNNTLNHATWGIRVDQPVSGAVISGNTITDVTYPVQCAQSC